MRHAKCEVVVMNRLVLVTVLAGVSSACSHDATAPNWPVDVQLRLVNTTTDPVFIRAAGDESLYPGIGSLVPNDSACTTVNAFADSVPVEVHSVTNPNFTYGSAWIYPLRRLGWRAVVSASGVTVAQSTACVS